MGGRDLFQVDQTKPVDQTLFRQLPQRRQITDLDCRLRLSHRHHRPQTLASTGLSAAFTQHFRGQYV